MSWNPGGDTIFVGARGGYDRKGRLIYPIKNQEKMKQNKRDERIFYILSYIKNRRRLKIDRKNLIAIATMEMNAPERVIREIIQSLELTKRIDKKIWK